MHPYLTHHNYLSSKPPYAKAFRAKRDAGGGFREWVRTAYRKWQRNKMIAAFHSLDDATLRDIGVFRGESKASSTGSTITT
ncbi:hypothetical protein [Marinovum sp.]|uniref:hypothetical protein n=1 Tax=Marinovum sp. TaxID=2024839 RepID=UPI002B27857B|nr:hypothetical protein [Marinovum sp.]